MIRHLAGGSPERRNVLTECSLMAAIPGTLMTRLEDVNCADCRASLVRRGVCPECGQERLVWDAGPVKLNTVADGRLTLRDVETQFHLGCDECSATLIDSVSTDEVVAVLNAHRWRP